ncbi:unnamed protein product [Rotaria sordida]|uniref:Uncharacterized protein n=1 Tax=Rotaria sordida TaxID=392033 RepID=A0A814L3T4_9BILA|nr:unnamed protein product [Rotaria sordida]CAF1237489.1 unnamed protein product [Rotaria sordida]
MALSWNFQHNLIYLKTYFNMDSNSNESIIIVRSFEKYIRQNESYSSINDIQNKDNVRRRDKMKNYFLVEIFLFII